MTTMKTHNGITTVTYNGVIHEFTSIKEALEFIFNKKNQNELLEDLLLEQQEQM